MIDALWAYRISVEISIGTSPFQLVYGSEVIFPNSLSLLVMRLLQEEDAKTHSTQRRMYRLVELQQQREQIFDRTQLFQDKMKEIFDRRTKPDDFQAGDVVLQWDAPHEEKGRHEKFNDLCKGPYKTTAFEGRNSYILEEMDSGLESEDPINGTLLKHYFL